MCCMYIITSTCAISILSLQHVLHLCYRYFVRFICYHFNMGYICNHFNMSCIYIIFSSYYINMLSLLHVLYVCYHFCLCYVCIMTPTYFNLCLIHVIASTCALSNYISCHQLGGILLTWFLTVIVFWPGSLPANKLLMWFLVG